MVSNRSSLLSMVVGGSGIEPSLLLESDEFKSLFKMCCEVQSLDEAYTTLMSWVENNF